jgi:hypothetical protein
MQFTRVFICLFDYSARAHQHVGCILLLFEGMAHVFANIVGELLKALLHYTAFQESFRAVTDLVSNEQLRDRRLDN